MERLMSKAAAIAAGFCIAISSVGALGGTFELEGLSNANIRDEGSADPTDWSALFDVPANELDTNYTNDSDSDHPTPKSSLPANVLRAGFFRDFTIGSTADATSFTTGTKDIQNISGGGASSGEWQCKKVNNISDKGDALNAYAAIQRHDNGDLMLIMGVERASDDGTSKVGFWFLQDKTVGCVATSGNSVTFTGNHVDGDLLVVINFSQGGNNPTPVLYRWTGNATTGTLVPVAVIGGGECTVGTSNDCATTNQVQTLLHSDGGVPWLTQTKTSGPNFSHDLSPLRYFEAQVNLTDHNLKKCFNRFMANTRQSDSTSATVFDYIIGDFNVCGFSASKACTAASITNGTDVNYTYKVTVNNTGIAPLSHVTVNENIAACTVAGNDQTVAEGTSKDFTVTCPNVGLNHTNNASISAVDDDGLAVPTVNVSAKSADAGACALNVTSDITMDRQCDGVVLEDAGGRVGLQATIGMTVHAPSGSNSEALKDVKIDVYDKTCTGAIGECTKIETISVASLLKYSDTDVVRTHTYDVSVDDNTSTSQCAANAIFQRRVVAYGTGAISGKSYWSSLLNDGTGATPVALEVDCKPCVDCSDPAPQQ
jgi:hypothetical protein